MLHNKRRSTLIFTLNLAVNKRNLYH